MTQTTDANSPQTGWGLWLLWVAANIGGTLCALLVFLFVFPLGFFFGELGEDTLARISVFGPSSIIGLWCILQLQWMVLREKIPHAKMWVISSLLGVLFGCILYYGIAYLFSLNLNYSDPKFAALSLIFFSLGIMQWLVLRKHFPQSGWWILASVAGSLIGWALLAIFSSFTISTIVNIVLYPTTTGIVLVWLLRRSTTLSP